MPEYERDEAFQFALPRSERMDGSNFRIVSVKGREITVTDGERSAVYVPLEGEPLAGTPTIVPAQYIEAGAFTEANCIAFTNGERRVIYVPDRIAFPPSQ